MFVAFALFVRYGKSRVVHGSSQKYLLLQTGHHYLQRAAEASSEHIVGGKHSVILEEKLPISKFHSKRQSHPPLYEPVPITDRLNKVVSIDQKAPNKHQITKPRSPDEQKPPRPPLKSVSRVPDQWNDNVAKRHKSENSGHPVDEKRPSSAESWRDVYLSSGVTKSQIPSQMGRAETFSDCDFTLHDPDSLSVLDISFPSNSNPTFGLPRSVTPADSEIERYMKLVENSIADHMVAPISNELVAKTHENVPKQLMKNFKSIIKDLDEVIVGYYHLIGFATGCPKNYHCLNNHQNSTIKPMVKFSF